MALSAYLASACRAGMPAGAIIVAALLFCWPALYNGFPLVYGDTASYLDTIDPRKTMWARQIFYTALLRALHWRISLWPAIFVQSLMVAHLLYLTLRWLVPRIRARTYLLTAALLAATTSLPWHSSALLPDVFTSVLVLAMFLIAFCRDSLSRVEAAYLAALVATATVIHLSHIPLAAGLIVVFMIAGFILPRRIPFRRRSALLVVLPVLAATSTHLTINYTVHSSISLSPASSIWLMARFIADGPGRAYLEDECPTRHLILCNYLEELPHDSDEFLWGNYTHDAVFYRAGGYVALRNEAHEIVAGTLARYPKAVLRAFVVNSARQFVDIGTGHWLDFGPDKLNQPISQYIAGQFPSAFSDYVVSPQVRGTIPIDTLAIWHVTFVLVATACIAGLVASRSLRSRQLMLFCLVLLAALIGNAMVTGGISAVHDRYQTRLVWLVVFAACAGVLSAARRADRSGQLPPVDLTRRWRIPTAGARAD